ncbi:hypothetical protein VI08_06630 [Luteibacter yeojuensis]|uniref:Uncharacterized protein n=1 Tax=Luteibacter yeojuensis TaxID=345309 RepID=A0A0F3L002_9GAMM|nr:hypothetical protein [Luteibacter yeojuensis]KJV35679.1 hypothetical protein VI08_06630 [Luteibacter yeojuensis]
MTDHEDDGVTVKSRTLQCSINASEGVNDLLMHGPGPMLALRYDFVRDVMPGVLNEDVDFLNTTYQRELMRRTSGVTHFAEERGNLILEIMPMLDV